ncbi:MAG: sigma-54-dependent Fis family transcriptional regulator [Planctomycetota bacterium]|mgnify:CR=1 FL=1|nr:MAG: sigma-54-dependent Fis family transcriptional regulator [Planctomycetota bacterium]
MTKLLVVDDDRTVLHLIDRWFEGTPTEVLTAGSASEALDMVETERPDVLLLDIVLPELSGLEACEAVRKIDARLPVIFITGHGSSELAIGAMKLGAYDYLLKPLSKRRLVEVVERAAEIRRLMHRPVAFSPEAAEADGDTMLGQSEAMQRVFKAIGRVAAQDVTVLVQGESGTGKELVARALYHHSQRADKPFLAINCAAIPETLLESEFFGHEKGSFTGAESRRIGKFEQCNGGTIFLDEIGDMPPLLQSKILRLLEDQQFERVGGNETIQTDVRIIAATNRDLNELVREARFREDLLYRLKGFLICLPPLRERAGDLRLLVEHALARFNREMGKQVLQVDPEVMQMFEGYDWPGNVRELESLLRQAVIVATGTVITPDCLPEMQPPESVPAPRMEPTTNGKSHEPPRSSVGPGDDLAEFIENRIGHKSHNIYSESVEFVERCLLRRVLLETGGNQSKAAKMLGITRGSLRNKIRALNLSIDHVVSVPEITNGRGRAVAESA